MVSRSSVRIGNPLEVSCFEYSCSALVGETCTFRRPRCAVGCKHEDVSCFHASRVKRWRGQLLRELKRARKLRGGGDGG